MGLVSVDSVGAKNVCGHCGFEFIVKFADMVITPKGVNFPRCDGCKVASEMFFLSSLDDIDEQEAEAVKQRHVAIQTLYKRALAKAKKAEGYEPNMFPSRPQLLDSAEKDDSVVVKPPLHSSIAKLRRRKLEGDKG